MNPLDANAWYEKENTAMELLHGAPADMTGRSDREIRAYAFLDKLGIEYDRTDHPDRPATTMEVCAEVDAILGIHICKNLFLRNRKGTEFYLLVMPGDKPFKTKNLTAQLNCARLSFGDADKMQEYLHTTPGSVSALELIFDSDLDIRLVIDNDLMKDEYISGHPGISTSTLRLTREDMLKYIKATGHTPTYIDLAAE